MDETEWRNGDVVLAGNGLGTLVRPQKIGRAEGWAVQSTEYHGGMYTQFVATMSLRRAVVGKTVCRHPKLTHFCGLLHVDHPEQLGEAS